MGEGKYGKSHIKKLVAMCWCAEREANAPGPQYLKLLLILALSQHAIMFPNSLIPFE